MTNLVKLAGSTVAMAAMVATAVPADARDWHRGRHYRGGDRIDGGDVLLGALLAGGVIAIASAASKRNDRPDPRYDAPPPPPRDSRYDDRDDDRDYAQTDDGYDQGGYDQGDDRGGYATGSTENAAVDACAVAAEDQGRRYAQLSHVTDITDVDPGDRGGFYVQGTIELRDGYRDVRTVEHRFRCSTVASGAPQVLIDGLNYAQR